MSKRLHPLAAAAAFAAALSLAPAAAAFIPEGHDVLEAAAYRRLLTAGASTGGRTAAGIDVLRDLVRWRVLRTPECFEPKPGAEAEACRKRQVSTPIAWWPVLGSGQQDLVSARQFSTNGQCFHFLAGVDEIWSSKKDAALGLPIGLATHAYARCTRLLGDLLDQTLADPGKANADLHGMYAMLHSVADSFSGAHVERDKDWSILYLKPWRLRAFIPYAYPPRWGSYGYLFGSSHHDAVIDSRDKEYLRDEPRCHAMKHAYAMPESCLSERGLRATDALVDLLTMVHRLMREQRDEIARADRPLEVTPVAVAWRAYLDRHLHSVRLTPDLRALERDEKEWSAAMVFGFRYRHRPVPGATDLSALVGTTLFSDITLPLSLFVSAEAGCRRILGQCRLELGIDPLTLLVPLTDSFAIGVTPVSILGQTGPGGGVQVGANVIRADLYLLDALWLSVSGPRWSWIHQAFDADPFSVAMGYAWDGETSPFRIGKHTKGESSAKLRVEPAREGTRVGGTGWTPPVLEDDYRRHSTTLVAHVVGGSLLPDKHAGAYSVGGVGVLWDRDHWNRRAGFAVGGRIDTEYRTAEHLDEIGLIGGPTVRYHLVPDLLAIELAPAMVSAGYRKQDEKGSPFIDVGGMGSVVLLPFGKVEIAVESPRLSYRTQARVEGTNLGLRLGFVVRD